MKLHNNKYMYFSDPHRVAKLSAIFSLNIEPVIDEHQLDDRKHPLLHKQWISLRVTLNAHSRKKP